MHCLEMAGKHVNSTWAITRQLLGKWVPTATDMHAMLLNYNTENDVFYVVHAE